MRKILTALVASALISATALTTSSPANAGGGWGWPFFWGGVAAGAIVGGALAAPYYRPYPYYYYGPGYGPRLWMPTRMERLRLGTRLLMSCALKVSAVNGAARTFAPCRLAGYSAAVPHAGGIRRPRAILADDARDLAADRNSLLR